MANFVRYQNEFRSFANEAIRRRLNCGSYAYGAELHPAGGHEQPHHHTVWVPDGVGITDSVSIEAVNGQLVASSEEDDHLYFWVSGKRGNSHNMHRKLLVPEEVELLAAGGKEAHTQGNCNKISSAIFRVPKGTKRVVIGDMYGSSNSEAITFTRADGVWAVTVEPYDRFCALNPNWKGVWLWPTDEENKPPLPLPALVE